jgi:endogenous inhibitor of DNA gyrase (YacG/DUF329 family)
MTISDSPPVKSAPCPVCGKPAVERHRPFCSPRCVRIDLNRWLSEVYVVPGSDEPANTDEPSDGDSTG